MLTSRPRLAIGTAVLAVAAGLTANAQQGGLFARTRARVSAMQILDRVYSRLHWEKALAGSVVEVVEDSAGVTVLRGTVTSAKARARAVELARNTVGVTQVVDELSVTAADPEAPAPVVKPAP
jgi:hyperosmotically inducible protein